MSGLSNGSTQTWDGDQNHAAPGWFNDPLGGTIEQFMNTQIPAGFGPVSPQLLTSVTSLTGTGYTALAAVPTQPLPTPFAVDVLINNVPQRYFLVAGTTGGGAGIVIPNDYNAVTNAKYWIGLE